MKVSRGQFLSTCGAALLGATLDAQSPGPRPLDIQHLQSDDFRQQINTTFWVRSSEHAPRPLLLTQVDRSSDDRIEQFSVVFQGPESASLPDGTYEFHHQAFGRFDLFIVRVGRPNGDRMSYEACFSRHVKAGWRDGLR